MTLSWRIWVPTCIGAFPNEWIIRYCDQSSFVNFNQLLSYPGIEGQRSGGFFYELNIILKYEFICFFLPYHICLFFLIDFFVLLDYFWPASPNNRVGPFPWMSPTSLMACKSCLLWPYYHRCHSRLRLHLNCCSYFCFLPAFWFKFFLWIRFVNLTIFHCLFISWTVTHD